jgi:hypothetical protein
MCLSLASPPNQILARLGVQTTLSKKFNDRNRRPMSNDAKPERRHDHFTNTNIGRQTLLVLTTARDLALRRAMLPERRTGATLGNMQLRSDLLNAGTATRKA